MKYVRTEVEEDLGSHWPFPWALSTDRDLRVKNHVIGFCGKIYPFLEVYTTGVENHRAFCHNIEELDAFVIPLMKKKALEAYHETIKNWFRYGTSFRRRYFKEFFEAAAKSTDKHQHRFEKNLSPVFVASLRGRAYKGYGYVESDGTADPGQKIVWNASLRDFDFMRIKDPYTAFQEISMYLGNMAFPNKPIPKISNNDMIEAKGFDLKHSFRKDKS